MINPALLEITRERLGMNKQAFIPSPQAGGPPQADPTQGGAPPGGAPPGGAPPGGDPSQMGGAPPGGGMPPAGDPSMGGGSPPGAPPAGGGAGLDVVMQTLQRMEQLLAQGGQPGAPGAGGPKKSGGKGGDELARQMYNQNVLLTAIITAMNKGGMQVEIPANMLLGPAPGTDPAMAAQQGIGAGMGQPGVAQPGDPNAQGPGGAPPGQDPNAAGGDPSQQPPQQQPMNFMPNLAPKTASAEEEEDLESNQFCARLGMPYPGKQAEMKVIPAMQELFGFSPDTPAPPGSTISDKAAAVFELIGATRRTRMGQ